MLKIERNTSDLSDAVTVRCLGELISDASNCFWKTYLVRTMRYTMLTLET